jgi:hypothetical protein
VSTGVAVDANKKRPAYTQSAQVFGKMQDDKAAGKAPRKTTAQERAANGSGPAARAPSTSFKL